tara:strand:+ start:2348 stop:2695 length:348 start_codon:yes stop_codon:yes gene_type:complete
MKKSELAKAIKETIIEVLQEATIETSAKDLDQVKASAGEDDVIKVTEEEDEDKEPTKSQLKNEPISKIGYKLADTQKEMKQVVKKWKTAEGAEKERLTNRLRDLTKIKKELEGLL